MSRSANPVSTSSLRVTMLSAVIVLASLSAGCATTTQAAGRDEAARLRQQADAWDRAIIGKDAAAVAANMAESFHQIDSQGGWSDKQRFLAKILSDRLVIAPYEPADVEIRFYGETALITGTTDLHGTFDGTAFRTHYRYTDVYAKEGGVWCVVNVQTTEIDDAS